MVSIWYLIGTKTILDTCYAPSSQTTKTKTLFTTENCRVTMRKPAGYGPQAQVSPHEPAKLHLW